MCVLPTPTVRGGVASCRSLTQRLAWLVPALLPHIIKHLMTTLNVRPHQKGSGGVKPWKISEELSYGEYMTQELGKFSKYFVIFLMSVRSSLIRPNLPNPRGRLKSCRIVTQVSSDRCLSKCQSCHEVPDHTSRLVTDRQPVTPPGTVCTNRHLRTRT